jgi:hypothetical protein
MANRPRIRTRGWFMRVLGLRATWSSLARAALAPAGCRSVAIGKARRCSRRGTPRGPLVRTGHRSRSCSHGRADRRWSPPEHPRVESRGCPCMGSGGARMCACFQRSGTRCGELTTHRPVRPECSAASGIPSCPAEGGGGAAAQFIQVPEDSGWSRDLFLRTVSGPVGPGGWIGSRYGGRRWL